MTPRHLNSVGQRAPRWRLLAAAATLGLALSHATTASAHPQAEAAEPPISAATAERQARRHLAALGYSRSIGPGGASVRETSLESGQWAVTVALRGHSATSVREHVLYVDARSGAVSETREPARDPLALR